MIQNSPKRVSETEYFLVSVDFVVMELTIRFKIEDEHAENSSFLSLKNLKEMKDDDFEMQCIKLHTDLMEILITLTVWNFFPKHTVFKDII